jgi:cytochrome b561
LLLLRLHKLALQLRPLLPWCYAVGFGGLGLAAAVLLQIDAKPSLALAVALGLTVWALLLFAFIRLFQAIPPPVLPKDTFFERLWSRCKLGLYHVLAFGVIIIGLALVSMSLKLLSISAG